MPEKSNETIFGTPKKVFIYSSIILEAIFSEKCKKLHKNAFFFMLTWSDNFNFDANRLLENTLGYQGKSILGVQRSTHKKAPFLKFPVLRKSEKLDLFLSPSTDVFPTIFPLVTFSIRIEGLSLYLRPSLSHYILLLHIFHYLLFLGMVFRIWNKRYI